MIIQYFLHSDPVLCFNILCNVAQYTMYSLCIIFLRNISETFKTIGVKTRLNVHSEDDSPVQRKVHKVRPLKS